MGAKRIIVPFGMYKELGKLFEVSQATVRRSLNGVLEGRVSEALAEQIRKIALKKGGVMVKEISPRANGEFYFETSFDTANNLMLQTFTDRVKIVADLSSGFVEVLDGEKVIDTYDNPAISDLPMIQNRVQEYINQSKTQSYD